uniref:NADH dehydrogenase subunit 6 n=1 Tax=Plesionika lophotes TaxID=1242014 RepID=UPI0023D8175F|nr:NADH dehydrogenase subunit 6 [Plesionika lophotes]WDD39150.1 NADH dehydrogenase subunit 6 [Plesionika lophotes]
MLLLTYCSLITSAISLCFLSTTNPIAMGLTLIAQTILICTLTSVSAKSSWFSYILFLIFLGAMLVLFIYVASLASNETFSLSMINMKTLSVSLLSLPLFLLMDPLSIPVKSNLENSLYFTTQFIYSTQFKLSMMYSPILMNLTLFIILYLLLTLIVVVNITSTSSGPLRLSS